jgi:hypothetical protein
MGAPALKLHYSRIYLTSQTTELNLITEWKFALITVVFTFKIKQLHTSPTQNLIPENSFGNKKVMSGYQFLKRDFKAYTFML